MYSYEIEEALKHFKPIFEHLQGIFPIDAIPKYLKELDCIIVNTE